MEINNWPQLFENSLFADYELDLDVIRVKKMT